MTTDTATRQSRVEVGESAERKFMAILLWHGVSLQKIGQESWLPDNVHDAIRYNYDSDVELLKHIPDYYTGRAMVQVKNAPHESTYEFVPIEKASYRASLRWHELGVPVLIVWLYQDGRTFMGQWVQDIHPIEPATAREDLKGSKTPMLLVAKRELALWSSFLEYLK